MTQFLQNSNTKQIFSNPSHPYTKALLASRSKVTSEDQQISFTLEGEVPSPIAPPPGCAFNPHCYSEYRSDECWKQTPHKIEVEEDHYIWCVNEDVLKEKNQLI
jgi:dipeptide transport system ATP-binding protein